MARPKHTTPTVQLNVSIPEPLMQKLNILLYSEVEQRIPLGAYKELFTRLLEKHFEDLANSGVKL